VYLLTLLKQGSRTIGTFSNPESAARALDRLILAGFPLANIFLIGKDFATWEQNGKVVQGCQLVNQVQPGAIAGTALGLTKGLVAGNVLGGAAGVLLGLGLLALPGVGQVALGSAVVFTLLSGGICTAAGGMIGALIGLGMTETQAREYSQQVAKGYYLIVVSGTDREIRCAERLLKTERIRR